MTRILFEDGADVVVSEADPNDLLLYNECPMCQEEVEGADSIINDGCGEPVVAIYFCAYCERQITVVAKTLADRCKG